MANNQTRAADLTVKELLALIRGALREELRHENQQQPVNQALLLELQPLHVGQWPEGLKLLSRDEFYVEN